MAGSWLRRRESVRTTARYETHGADRIGAARGRRLESASDQGQPPANFLENDMGTVEWWTIQIGDRAWEGPLTALKELPFAPFVSIVGQPMPDMYAVKYEKPVENDT